MFKRAFSIAVAVVAVLGFWSGLVIADTVAHVTAYPGGYSIVSWTAQGDDVAGEATAYTDSAPIGMIYKAWARCTDATNEPASTVTWNAYQFAVDYADTTDLLVFTSDNSPVLQSKTYWPPDIASPVVAVPVMAPLKLTASGLTNAQSTGAIATLWLVIGPPDQGTDVAP